MQNNSSKDFFKNYISLKGPFGGQKELFKKILRPILGLFCCYYSWLTWFDHKSLDISPVDLALIIHIEKAYERLDAVKPYIIEPKPLNRNNKVHSISPKRLDQYINATRCINCFCCASACISSHRNFLGPNAMLAAIIRMMDPREMNKKDRKKVIYSEQGVYRCHTSRACSFICPKEIDVAHFIALAKAGHFQDNNK